MSSSTSSAPPTALGECVVCGKESSTRCSSCAEGGVDWMYFCSREHQKLIWSVHKRVCGGTFRWPAITPKEKDEMIRLSTDNFDEFGVTTTWLAAYGTAILTTGSMSPEALASHTLPAVFKGYVTKLMEGGAACSENQKLLFEIRSSSFNVKSRLFTTGRATANFVDFHKLVATDPVSFLAWTQLRNVPGCLDWFDKPWYSDLQHKIMILVGILNYFRLTPSSSPSAFTEFAIWASEEIKEFARSVVRRVDSKEAAEIIEVYIPALFDVTGTELRTVGES